MCYTFHTVHYGKLLKKRPTNAPVVYVFYSQLHVSVEWDDRNNVSVNKWEKKDITY